MRNILLGSILFVLFSLNACAQENRTDIKKVNEITQDMVKAKITFIELGSVNCIPCKMMVPVMEAIEKKYGNQLEILFYDVWKPEQKKYAREYGIKLIPTQVFLDEDGKEFFRHEGFFAEDKIDSLLQLNGLHVLNAEEGN